MAKSSDIRPELSGRLIVSSLVMKRVFTEATAGAVSAGGRVVRGMFGFLSCCFGVSQERGIKKELEWREPSLREQDMEN
ncbi:hypothetical protein MHYP_G00267490 [Metynnis hypsauchen]